MVGHQGQLIATEAGDTASFAASLVLSDQAWRDFCAAAVAAGLTPDAEARAFLSAVLFEEYPAFARMNDRARVAKGLRRAERMLKHLAAFADDYRAQPSPDVVETEAHFWCMRLLRQYAEANWLGARVIRRANAGRKSVPREWLYHRLCSIWLDNFGGELTVRVPPLGGPPYGPLIDFILAAFRQVASADELPSPETVRDAIDREDRERKLLRQLVELRTQRHAQRTRTPI
jgi:hypothetical protein